MGFKIWRWRHNSRSTPVYNNINNDDDDDNDDDDGDGGDDDDYHMVPFTNTGRQQQQTFLAVLTSKSRKIHWLLNAVPWQAMLTSSGTMPLDTISELWLKLELAYSKWK